MKTIYFLQGYLHKVAGLGAALKKLSTKPLVGSPKHSGNAATATAAAATGVAGKSFYDLVRANVDAQISDQEVEKGKEKLRKARNPHNHVNKKIGEK